jgi:hypothetical protein
MWVAMLPMIRWAARRLRTARFAGGKTPYGAARVRAKGRARGSP